MSGVVGSTPSFTRRGRPLPSWRSSSPSGRASTELRVRKRAASAPESVIGPMLDCRTRWAPGGRPCDGPQKPPSDLARMRNTPLLGRSQHTMPEPPTFIHDLTPQRGPRFVRAEASSPPPAPPEPPKPRLKKLRLFLVLSGLTILALI